MKYYHMPNDATHYNTGNSMYYKKINGFWYYYISSAWTYSDASYLWKYMVPIDKPKKKMLELY